MSLAYFLKLIDGLNIKCVSVCESVLSVYMYAVSGVCECVYWLWLCQLSVCIS